MRPEDEDCEDFTPVRQAFGAHHLLWLSCLQRVEDGEITRLMGLMPPGSAKSTYTSVVFPTHAMGRFPGHQIITASYGSDLPRKFGRKSRSIVRQAKYELIFDARLSSESSAADEWALTNGSEWMGAGILSGITGNRANGIVWDDLIKGREQADSETIRNKTWDAYFDDLLTRKKPNGWEVGITTRWHEDDPAGRILPRNYDGESGWVNGQDGNDWFVICIPAEANRLDDPLGREIGERIWPEWFGPSHFAPFKRVARTWSALYQQRPAPETGTYFKDDWLRPYYSSQWTTEQVAGEPARETMHIYGASDYAVTEDGGDYTVHIVVGVDPQQRLWLLDLWRAQANSADWVEAFCDLVKLWKPLGWAEETGQIKAGVGPFLRKRQRERGAYVVKALFPTKGDKVVRSRSIQGRMEMDGLYVPINAPWYPEFRAELLAFNAGKHDDQVDALGLIGQVLDKMIGGREAPPTEPHKIISTDPAVNNVTLADMFKTNERRGRRQLGRSVIK